MGAKAIACSACNHYEEATSRCLQYQTVVSRPNYVYKYCPMGEFKPPASNFSSSGAEPASPDSPPTKVKRVKSKPKAKTKVKRKVKKKAAKKIAARAPEPGMVKITDNSDVEGQTTLKEPA